MKLDSKAIPDHILKLMGDCERKGLGKAGRTVDEIIAENAVKNERQLHEQIMQELNRRQIWYCHSRMDKKTTTSRGTPDFLLSIKGVPHAWECKVGYNDLSDEQIEAREDMEKNGWRFFVVRNLQYAIEILNMEHEKYDHRH